MADRQRFYIIEDTYLPWSIAKVLEAKKLLESGAVSSISQAVEQVGISRSVYYKYQHAVKPFFKQEGRKSVTLGLNLYDYPGVLSDVLSALASFNVNLLTINQTIPINQVANVTLTFETLEVTRDLEELIQHLNNHEYIKSVTILGRETL